MLLDCLLQLSQGVHKLTPQSLILLKCCKLTLCSPCPMSEEGLGVLQYNRTYTVVQYHYQCPYYLFQYDQESHSK
jgi:hypothetical protein